MHVFRTYLLSACCIPGTVLGPEDSAVDEAEGPCPHGPPITASLRKNRPSCSEERGREECLLPVRGGHVVWVGLPQARVGTGTPWVGFQL